MMPAGVVAGPDHCNREKPPLAPTRAGEPSLGPGNHYPRAAMPTRYLILAALLTALVILVGVGVWFLLGVL